MRTSSNSKSIPGASSSTRNPRRGSSSARKNPVSRDGSSRSTGKRASIRHLGGHVDPRKPAGNAQLDSAQQTVRTDMPRAAQKSKGKRGRGTAPSRSVDRSHQPRPHDRAQPDGRPKSGGR